MLGPQEVVTVEERERGIRNLMIDAATATAIGALNSGVVLVALALHVGATNVEIGFLAAIPLLTQILQAPTVRLVERVRKRRLISVISLFIARLALPLYALVPFIPDRDIAMGVLLLSALLHYGLNAVGACSWNSWIRDLIPGERLGAFSSRRGLYGTMVSTVATVAAAIALDATGSSTKASNTAFSALYMAGFVLGLISIYALARVPEPKMEAGGPAAPLHKLLLQPIRDRNFRNMLRYLASWQFAVNLATPFFTVYFVRELGFSMGQVLMLTVVSQLANATVVRGWGRLSDRFANKSVLAVATPLFIVSIAAMAFASEFSTQNGRFTFLVLLHIVMGAAGAGVGLASGNIVMRLSPSGSATSYMATNALVGALAAGIAPIVGGWAADFFARRRLAINVEWASPAGLHDVLGLSITHWEFFFLLSAIGGLYTLHRLSAVEEAGTVEPRQVVQHIFSSARRTLRNASTVAGLRVAVAFPAADLIKAREPRKLILKSVYGAQDAATPPGKAVGTLLGATFDPPGPDPTMDRLLRELTG